MTLAALRLAIVSFLLLACWNRCPESPEHAPTAIMINDLNAMREAMDRFHEDKGRWPDSLVELIPAYLRHVPVDPVTKRHDTWVFTPGDASKPADVRSGASGKNCDGVLYSSL